MIIKRIKYSIVFIAISFSFVNLAHASVVINEVQISPNDARFIELYNSGSSFVDLTNWYIQRKTASGTFTSLVTKPNFEGKIIAANSYFLISKTNIANADIVFDALTLTESNTIQIKDADGNVVDKVGWGSTNDCVNPCVSNPASGQSISRDSNNIFVISSPTPKEANGGPTDNNAIVPPTTSDGNNNSTSVSTSGSSTPKAPAVIYKISTKIIAPKVVTAGVPFTIEHTTTGLTKEQIIIGRFVWNFGDGMKKEVTTSDPFEYIYQYPGEYVLTLSYADTVFDVKPDSTDRLTIKVIPSGVVISSVGTYTDPFIEIMNNSNYEMSLNKWILKGTAHSFLIPEGMVILQNKKLKFSPRITGFDFNDLSSISIIDQSGQVFATYPNRVVSTEKYSTNKSFSENVIKSDVVANNKAKSITNSSDIINLNDLGASAEGTKSGLNNKALVYLGLVGILIIGIIGVILIRRKQNYPDYVEKEISASDMTIIE